MVHVSIIIPIFNRADLIKDTLDSVLWQSNGNWECILVDDGSTDNTWEVLERYKERDKRIRIYKRDRGPKSASTCRNIGIEKSQFDYLFFLDSDDILAPWSIENRLDFAKKFKNEFDVLLFGGMEFNNSDLTNRNRRGNFSINNFLEHFLNYQVCWGTANVLWNKDFINKIGGWFEPALSSQDSVLHLIALYSNARVKNGDEIPDFFVRVETDFDKISNTNSTEKIESRLITLEYIQSKLQEKDFNNYSYYFIIDLINRIELLDKKALNQLIENGMVQKKISAYLFKTYLYLYARTRNNSFFHPIVYRSRNIILKHKRILNIRTKTKLPPSVFNELISRSASHKILGEKVLVLKT